MSKALRESLVKLAKLEKLNSSQLSAAQRSELDNFMMQTGAVTREQKGRGISYKIHKPDVFRAHLAQLAPRYAVDYPESDAQQLPKRAQHILSARNSKASRYGHECVYPLLKAVGGQVLWSNCDTGKVMELHEATTNYGAGTLQFTAEDGWSSEQPLWLVENQAIFDQPDWLPDEKAQTLLFYSGNMSNTLLDWLAHKSRAPEIILFCDYDGVGISNYARLRNKVGEHCQFWLMPNWQSKLMEFGNTELWQKTRKDFDKAKYHIGPDLQALVQAMQLQGRALEQEAVWI